MKKDSSISFIESTYKLLKGFLKQERETTWLTPELINALNKELSKTQNLLVKLNKDVKVEGGIEKILCSDLVQLYRQFSSKESDRSKFVLAYYIDALINQHFADEKRIQDYEALVKQESFRKQLFDLQMKYCLKNHGSTTDLDLAGNFDSSSAEFKEVIAVYEKFIESAFVLKFRNDASFQDVFPVKYMQKVEFSKQKSVVKDTDSLELTLQELNGLIGLDNIKKDVGELVNLIQVQLKRKQAGLKNTEISLHTVFMGPPGTGKTTVARLLGRLFKHLGLLSKGHLIETDREGLVAGYVGQTAIKTDKIIEESRGGVLFIDEAYSLIGTGLNDFGSEAINILLKRMEDYRDDLVVVVAGYKDQMQFFIDSNPGLQSRFSRYFHFEHFTACQMMEILEKNCSNSDFVLNEDAKDKFQMIFELCYEKKNENFGNARFVRNLFEKCIQNQANRIIQLKEINAEVLKSIIEDDIPEPKEVVDQMILKTGDAQNES